MTIDLQSGAESTDMALTFSLDGETFALPVIHVGEIIDPLPITPIPTADPFSPGLINVRGAIAPFLDIRQRLGMAPAAMGEESRMLVLELMVAGTPTKVAILADDVADITETPLSEREPVPDLGVRWPVHFLDGVLNRNGEMIVVLDTETIFAPAPPN